MKSIRVAIAFIITDIYIYIYIYIHILIMRINVPQEMNALFCEINYVNKIFYDLQVSLLWGIKIT
jgi:hypothetical protein